MMKVFHTMLRGPQSREDKKLRFTACDHALKCYPYPAPASKKLPRWFRKLKPVVKGEAKHEGTVKRCIPFLDAATAGYIIPAWQDILVCVHRPVDLYDENDNFIKTIDYNGDETELLGEYVNEENKKSLIKRTVRSDKKQLKILFPQDNIHIPNGDTVPALGSHTWSQVGNECPTKKYPFGESLLKLNSPWNIQTPKGWSCYFKNPANSFENDIIFFEGSVDTDEYNSPINFPFIWSGEEEGEFLIEAGTPLIHVIPFKRETLDLEVIQQTTDFITEINGLMDTKLYDRYKTFFWHKRKKD